MQIIELGEKDAEIERLKGLIESVFHNNARRLFISQLEVDNEWLQFKKDNQL